jgi:hypothetical protein
MNRSGCSMASLARGLFVFAALAVVGCGQDDFSDDAYGFIDLSPYFYDGSSAANPVAGLATTINPSRGWNNGFRAEYYDFGLVGISRKRDSKGVTLAEPDYAYVQPMYFFYDSGGRPMFSKPIYDRRTGQWWMKGGQGLLNPNPILPRTGASMGEINTYYSVPYSVRVRKPLVDDKRSSSDFQRPVINVLQDNTRYSGLWEVIEVKVQDGGYAPDSVKSEATLLAGVSAGKFSLTHTAKVIACPVLDDRTSVTPSVMAYNIPRPRIELWYRTKLGTCYLVNGYETIARTLDDGNAELDARDPANIDLLKAGSPDRVNTFDVISFQIGDQPFPTVVAPTVKMYTPRATVATLGSTLRYPGDDLSTTLPKHRNSDPGGYSPIVWSWEIGVPQDPPFTAGTYKSLDRVDPSVLAARTGGPWTRHYAVIGIARPCKSGTDDECRAVDPHLELTCNTMPDVTIATTSPPTGKNVADLVIEREGGPRCDIKPVGYGDYCAPGIARCEVQSAAGAPNETAMKAVLGKANPGPTPLTVNADLTKAQTALTTAQAALDALMAPPTPPPAPAMESAAIVKARADLTAATTKLQSAKDAVAKYQSWGFLADIGGLGYQCQPPTGGYCYFRCDGGATATPNPSYKISLPVPDPRDTSGKATKKEDHVFNTDPRCGGDNMLGYKCMPVGGSSKRNVCLRECSTQNTDGHNRLACDYALNAQDGGNPKGFSMSDGEPAFDSHQGQQCYTSAGVTACQWNPDFEPRNPKIWPKE